MEYQPDWKSKILANLFGKRRLMTLLDTSELMQNEDFKTSSLFKPISDQIMYTAVAANAAVIFTSIILSRTVFSKSHFFSPTKLISDLSLIFLSYYAAALYLSQAIKKEVQLSKYPYFKRFDEKFLFHFNLLSAKYQIDEKIQTEDIFVGKAYEDWMDEYFKQMSQIKQ